MVPYMCILYHLYIIMQGGILRPFGAQNDNLTPFSPNDIRRSWCLWRGCVYSAEYAESRPLGAICDGCQKRL